MPITETQRLILTAAAAHPARMAIAPVGLPAAARNAVFRAMLKSGLLTEVPAAENYAEMAWRQDETGVPLVLKLTDDGLAAAHPEQPAPEAAVEAPGADQTAEADLPRQDAPEAAAEPLEAALVPEAGPIAPTAADAGAEAAPVALDAAMPSSDVDALQALQAVPAAPQRASLRQTADALLAAWDGNDGERLAASMTALRTALAGKPARQPRDPAAPRQPRQGTKQEAVLALLRRTKGATVGQIAEATGWQQHTVRGFFAGLKKRGIDVTVLERVRQVGPDKQGAKGSYSVYRIAAAA